MEKVKNPICPYCKTETVSILVKYEDSQLFGWTCNCGSVQEMEKGEG